MLRCYLKYFLTMRRMFIYTIMHSQYLFIYREEDFYIVLNEYVKENRGEG